VINKGSHVRRNDGLVHQVEEVVIGVKTDGSPDLNCYWTECDPDYFSDYVPFNSDVPEVEEDVTCMACVAR